MEKSKNFKKEKLQTCKIAKYEKLENWKLEKQQNIDDRTSPVVLLNNGTTFIDKPSLHYQSDLHVLNITIKLTLFQKPQRTPSRTTTGTTRI